MSRDSRLARFGRLPRLVPDLGILPPAQRELWPTLGDIPEDFVLYGGTGLALHLGHRQSADFDFFSADPFAPTELLAKLAWLGRLTIDRAAPDSLACTTEGGARFAFFGGMRIQAVAEPVLADENGVVVASVFDLAGTKAKALLDRSEWRDYVDIAALLRHGLGLPEIVGFASAIFDPLFEFPAAAFLRALVYFEEGTAPDVPAAVRRELEAAVKAAERAAIPIVEPYSISIRP